jgi:glycosyltransferase involved in cell wall biosynthesis
MPRVSVIIPAFNVEPFIGETLASVEAQTYRDWEIVVGDDASTDGTADVIRVFGTRALHVRSPDNAGPADARNRAISRASGELLAFLDADDLWLPEYLDEQVSLFDKARAAGVNVGIVACNARILGADGLLPGTYADRYGPSDGLTLRRLLGSNPIFVSALTLRVAVDEAGGFSTEIVGTEDYDLWVRILELGYQVVASSRPLAVYRLRPGSISTRAGAMARASQLVYQRALDRGMLSPRERRVARRELRLQRAVERVVSAERPFSAETLKALPLLAAAAAEHPRRWPAYARRLLSPLAGDRGS